MLRSRNYRPHHRHPAKKRDELPPSYRGGQDDGQAAVDAALPLSGHGLPSDGILHPN
jgi:hypothetical protein